MKFVKMRAIEVFNFGLKTLMMTFAMTLCYSCGNDDDENSSYPKGYYSNPNERPIASDFSEINQSINNHELLYSLAYIRGNHEYDTYATRDLFFDSDGYWSTYENHFGPYRFKPDRTYMEVWNFVSKNTVELIYGSLGDPNKIKMLNNMRVVYKVNVGSPIGTLWMVGEARTYTYTMLDGKIVVSDGTIFTMSSSASVIKDGTSDNLEQYDPNKYN